MKTYQVSMWMVGAVVVLLAGSSASEAGWLRGGGRCYYYPAESTYSVATSPATAPAQTASPRPAGPAVHQVYKPVDGPDPMPATYAPTTTAGGGSSVMPRSSWDFGSFPPFR